MSEGQKVIKILASIFAVFLIVNIFAAIIGGVTLFAGIFLYSSDNKSGSSIESKIEELEQIDNVQNIDIDIKTSNIEIIMSDEFKISKNNTSDLLECKVNKNTLKIEEKNSANWLNNKNKSKIIIYIPQNKMFDSVKISNGVGNSNINDIKTNRFDLKIGVGNVNLKNIQSQSTKISGGAGNLTATDIKFGNLELDSGVGKNDISGYLTGNSKINCGIGKLDLNLEDKLENYKIKTKTGIGSIKINESNCSDGESYGTGDRDITINGGIGTVDITTL